MATLLEQLHKMQINDAVDDLTAKGGNQNVAAHPLDGIYYCKACGYIFDEKKEGKAFTTLSHCPICGMGQQQFFRINGEREF